MQQYIMYYFTFSIAFFFFFFMLYFILSNIINELYFIHFSIQCYYIKWGLICKYYSSLKQLIFFQKINFGIILNFKKVKNSTIKRSRFKIFSFYFLVLWNILTQNRLLIMYPSKLLLFFFTPLSTVRIIYTYELNSLNSLELLIINSLSAWFLYHSN